MGGREVAGARKRGVDGIGPTLCDALMKPLLVLSLVSLLASTLFVGCTKVSFPAARSYSVQIGTTQYHAKSIKLHGEWAEVETEAGTVWTRHAPLVITPNR